LSFSHRQLPDRRGNKIPDFRLPLALLDFPSGVGEVDLLLSALEALVVFESKAVFRVLTGDSEATVSPVLLESP